MSLSDCPQCWDTPCNCSKGYLESKNHAYEQLKNEYDILKQNYLDTIKTVNERGLIIDIYQRKLKELGIDV